MRGRGREQEGGREGWEGKGYEKEAIKREVKRERRSERDGRGGEGSM